LEGGDGIWWVMHEHPPHNVHIIEFEMTHLKVVLWIQYPYETRLARTEIGGQLIKGFGCQHLSFKVQTWAAREFKWDRCFKL
jgi:hypothetical protein